MDTDQIIGALGPRLSDTWLQLIVYINDTPTLLSLLHDAEFKDNRTSHYRSHSSPRSSQSGLNVAEAVIDTDDGCHW